MKVILTRDVKGVGRAHDALTLADGYALNYLIPQKFAIPATDAALTVAQARQKLTVARHEIDAKLLAQNLASLADARVVITMKANEKGHLYDAVGADDIQRAVQEEMRIDLPKDAIKLEKPIKELGTFVVPISAGDVFGTFSITVQAE